MAGPDSLGAGPGVQPTHRTATITSTCIPSSSRHLSVGRGIDLPIRTLPFRWADGALAELAKLRHPDVSLVDFYGPGVEEGSLPTLPPIPSFGTRR